jgi:hypothetical protein
MLVHTRGVGWMIPGLRDGVEIDVRELRRAVYAHDTAA